MSKNSLKTIPISKKLPKYGYQISRTTTLLDDGRMLATMKLSGMPFETNTEGELEAAFHLYKNLINQLAKNYGKKLAIWNHIIKKKVSLDESYQFPTAFMQGFAKQYIDAFQKETFYQTEYYVSFVYKYSGSIENGSKDFDDLLSLAKSSLSRFECSVLAIEDAGRRCKNTEFLSFLMNNRESSIPLTSTKVVDLIKNSDWHFGYDLCEIRNLDSQESRYATFYEIDSYPVSTERGMWDFILDFDGEFVISQSMILMKPASAISTIDTKINETASAEGSDRELEELQSAKEHSATGEISFGDYHCSIAIYADTAKDALDNGSELASEFLGKETILKRSNLKSQFSFLSALPASKDRILPSPRTATNLACTFSLHNHPQGKKSGNPIGDGSALIPLKTTSNTLFYLNCHDSELYKNVTGQKYAGHTMLLGATGAGKTTLEGVLVGFATRFNPQLFCIDYNNSTELYMRAYGAEYFSIREGKDTGINLFQLDDSQELRGFLNLLVNNCGAEPDGSIIPAEEKEIEEAIAMVMRLPQATRGFSRLLDMIANPHLRMKLSKWCRSENGSLAWCLDSPVNKFDPSSMDKIGFDTTMLLTKYNGKAHPAAAPVLSALFFLKNQMQKEGRLMVTIVEEFWMPANMPITQDEMKTTLKAGRLKGEFMILSSQSPEDAINCELFAPIIQQTATKIYLPNPDAEFESYKSCNVNQAEFSQLKQLDKTSRRFLIKQSNTSCFAKLDLHGFDDYLPIISGTTENIELVNQIRSEHGDDPDVWIPKFRSIINEDELEELDCA